MTSSAIITNIMPFKSSNSQLSSPPSPPTSTLPSSVLSSNNATSDSALAITASATTVTTNAASASSGAAIRQKKKTITMNTKTKTKSSSNGNIMVWAIGILSIVVFIRASYFNNDKVRTTFQNKNSIPKKKGATITTSISMMNMRGSSSSSSSMESGPSHSHSNSITSSMSWMEQIVYFRTRFVDVAHELRTQNKKLKRKQRTKEKNTKHGTIITSKYEKKEKQKQQQRREQATTTNNESTNDRDDVVDISLLRDVTIEAVTALGVRGVLFEVLSDDFEYYVYNGKKRNDDGMTELQQYWQYCSSKHGVGEGCNEYDVWWIYHYVGAIITDIVLEDHQIVWDGSSSSDNSMEMITTSTSTSTSTNTKLAPLITKNKNIPSRNNNSNKQRKKKKTTTTNFFETDNKDNIVMATLLDKIHTLQATLPYVNQASFHTQHALIWRWYVQMNHQQRNQNKNAVQKNAVQKNASNNNDSQLIYPWDVAVLFCRGDGSRRKGINGRPVNKGIDHECFHGFGHAMFYAVATKQYSQKSIENNIENENNNDNETAPYMVIRPNSGFTLSSTSYCEIYDLCSGASPNQQIRDQVLDPHQEASSNSYTVCLQGVVHSIRLLSNTRQMMDKPTAISIVDQEMTRCSNEKKKK